MEPERNNSPVPVDVSNIKKEDFKKEETDDTNAYDYAQEEMCFNHLYSFEIEEQVISKLIDIFRSGKLTVNDLDDRTMCALKDFSVDGALNILQQVEESNLEHVSNKSAFVCGIMKSFRQQNKASKQQMNVPGFRGPNTERINAILERTGYKLDVTPGQRKYGGPPPVWEGSPPGKGCEVFCGKIPRDIYEDELIPLFEQAGKIWDLRLMMDLSTQMNCGFAFITYTNKEDARRAVLRFNEFEIRSGRYLKVNISVPNVRLFVGNIPKSMGKGEIQEEFGRITKGLKDVIIYSIPDDRKKNRGFCFLEFESHKAASFAKRRLSSGSVKVWGCDILVDWADPQQEPDEEIMAKVKVVYIRNLTHECTEDTLKHLFEMHGRTERIKKIKDYAFVHFEEREHALKAIAELNGKELCGSAIEVSLAKPPSDKKMKEEILRARERRMMKMMEQRGGIVPPVPLRGTVGAAASGTRVTSRVQPTSTTTVPRPLNATGSRSSSRYPPPSDSYGYPEWDIVSAYPDPFYL